VDDAQHLFHRRPLGDELRGAARHLAPQDEVFAPEALTLFGLAEDEKHLVRAERLAQVVVRACLECLDGEIV